MGIPVIAYGGFATLSLFVLAAYIGYTNHHHVSGHLAFKWHPAVVMAAFVFAFVHMIFGLSVLIGF